MKFDALIFDVDGTLWDTTALCAEAYNRAIEKHSTLEPNVTAEQLKDLFGKPMKEIFQILFPTMSEDEQMQLAIQCEESENELLQKKTGIPFPEVVSTIKELSKVAELYIVSNCQIGYIEICMESLGICDCIKDYTCYGINKVSKGQNIKRLMERNGLKNVAYVGDTQGDEEACKEAGIPMIYASYGFGKAKQPEFTIDKFAQLLSLVLS